MSLQQSSGDGAGDTPVPLARHSKSSALAAEVRDGLSRKRRELPNRFLADRAIAATRRTIEQIIDDRVQRVEGPLVRAWIGQDGAALQPRRLVDVIPAGVTTAHILLESPVTRAGLRECVVVEETADLANEGAGRCAAAHGGCACVAVVANPTMTIPVARSARTCFTLFGGALTRFSPVAAVRLLRAVRAAMTTTDLLLVGLDLRTPSDQQRAATEHGALLTVWHRHVLTVANRDLGMEFPVESFEYECTYDDGAHRIEHGLTCAKRSRVTSPIMEPLILRSGEHLRTGMQHSYGRIMLEPMLRGVGLMLHSWREAPDGSHGLAAAVAHSPRDNEP
jgi:L-histidine Nalpha-methyltransferase